MTQILNCFLFAACLLLLPFFTVGIIRKTKAAFQGRLGAPVWQPLSDMIKLFQKGQTISVTCTAVFRLSSALNVSAMLLLAVLVPWLSFKPSIAGDDLFLVLYMFALLRFSLILSSLDSGSPFGAFGASREAYLAMLTEPALFTSLVALGLMAHSSSLSIVFDYSRPASIYEVPVWLASAVGLFFSSIADLSRMPIDDPATHLELTMVHEAMILENSGRNLAAAEFAHMLKLVVLYGLTAQCLLHAATFFYLPDENLRAILSVAMLPLMAFITATIESVSVKLRWRAAPDFIAYALTAGLLAAGGSLIGGLYGRHGL